jgi:hypothetical protein
LYVSEAIDKHAAGPGTTRSRSLRLDLGEVLVGYGVAKVGDFLRSVEIVLSAGDYL